MTVTELLAQFSNPTAIKSLPIADKLSAGLITTVLGMGITFIALIILLFIISWLNILLNGKNKVPVTDVASAPPSPANSKTNQKRPNEKNDGKELVAVITAAIAMKMNTSVNNIVIKDIQRVEDKTPAWNRAGLINQINGRF